jgi:uncharacterized protein (TIGR00369 family)
VAKEQVEELDFAEALNAQPEGWVRANGVRFTRATASGVAAEVTLGPEHLQAYGIVHGGLHCGLIETLASVGAALYSLPDQRSVVGLENHTSFIRAARLPGVLRAVATPLTRGRRTQVWEAKVEDDEGRLLASGRVRLLCLEAEASLAGSTVEAVPLK